MKPYHVIDLAQFQAAFENYTGSQKRTFGIVQQLIIEAKQYSEPPHGVSVLQYITSKELHCSIDIDRMLYNEIKGGHTDNDYYWFDFYCSGYKPSGQTNMFNITEKIVGRDGDPALFKDAIDVYNSYNYSGGDTVGFFPDDDSIFEDQNPIIGERPQYEFGYVNINASARFSFQKIIAYDKAYVDSDGVIIHPDPDIKIDDFDYRYKAIVMRVDLYSSSSTGVQIEFDVIVSENNRNVDDKTQISIDNLMTAIQIYNDINLHTI